MIIGCMPGLVPVGLWPGCLPGLRSAWFAREVAGWLVGCLPGGRERLVSTPLEKYAICIFYTLESLHGERGEHTSAARSVFLFLYTEIFHRGGLSAGDAP